MPPHQTPYRFKLNADRKLSKIQQIVHTIKLDIEKGMLPLNYRLPSINEFSKRYAVARDTIEKAYKELKKDGYIVSAGGRGYFVLGKQEQKLKILLMFNKLSSYKNAVYNSFLETIGDKATVDLQVFHYSPAVFKEILEANLGRYHHYVIMPHFFHKATRKETLGAIETIPEAALLVLDKNLPELGNRHRAVFQDFREDIYEALESANDLMEKYSQVNIVFPVHSHHPIEIVEGISKYCLAHQKILKVINEIHHETPEPKTAYIIVAEDDLAPLIKKIRATRYKLGKDIGIISFNDTDMKDLLDITVVTTDFDGMGRTAAKMILENRVEQIRNPFMLTRRKSL